MKKLKTHPASCLLAAVSALALMVSCTAPGSQANPAPSWSPREGGAALQPGQGSQPGGDQAPAPGANGQGAASGQPGAGSGNSGGGTSSGGSWGGSGSGNSGKTGYGGAVSVKTQKVKSAPLMVEHQNSGTVVAVTTSQVAALGSGVVTKLLAKPGDWVSAGQIIVQLDQRQAQLTVQNAQAVLDNANLNLNINSQNSSDSSPKLQLQLESAQSALLVAQRNFDSAQAQFDLGGISQSDLDNYKALLQTSKANLETAKVALSQNRNAGDQTLAQLRIAVNQAAIALKQAQLTLANTQIPAPMSGQIMSITASLGSYVSQSSTAFTLVSAERNLSFSVSPNDSPLLTPGMKVIFTSGGKAWSARISQIPSAPVNGLVAMTASLDRAQGLPFGAVGVVSYQVSLGNGPQVPVTSLLNRGDQLYVFVVQDGKVMSKDVGIVAETGSTAIVSGLSNGDEVILNPPPGLLPGSSVRVLQDGTRSGQQGGTPGSQMQENGSTAKADSATGTGSAGSSEASKGSWSGKRPAASDGSQPQANPANGEGADQGSVDSQGSGQVGAAATAAPTQSKAWKQWKNKTGSSDGSAGGTSSPAGQ